MLKAETTVRFRVLMKAMEWYQHEESNQVW